MSGAARRRGQPLALLGAVLGGWIALRAVLWDPAPMLDGIILAAPAVPQSAAARLAASPAQSASAGPISLGHASQTTLRADRQLHPLDRTPASAAPSGFPAATRPAGPFAPAMIPPREPMIGPRIAAGHQLMMMAALGQLPLPPLLAAQMGWPAPQSRKAPDTASRWSGDGWVLLRRGADGLTAAPSFARYGASQAGAVLRYSLAPSSPLRPQAHVRLTHALVSGGGSEAAAGLSLRPLRGVPLRLYGEGRAQRVAGATNLRPAASLVTELPPFKLPLGAEAEVYAQGGYVGGRGATPFFDAQVTADRTAFTRGPAELRLGAGAWAGGQEGATRLDLGPRASVRLRIGQAPARLALDWRFRVAGNAAPASGPALTLSAGF